MRRTFPTLLLLAAAACAAPQREPDASGAATTDAARADGVSVSALVADLPAERADALCGGRGPSFLAEAALLERVRAAAEDEGDDAALRAPRLLLADGGEGTISAVEPVAYVSGWRAGGGGAPEPVGATVDDGLWLEARPALVGGGRVRLAYVLRRERVRRPIASSVVDLPGADRRVRVELPSVAKLRAAGEATLAPGECQVVLLAESPDAAVVTLAVLTAAPAALPREAGFRVDTERAELAISR